MKTLLVTGGAGFIGSNFIRMVLDEHPEYQVVNYDKLTYAGNVKNLADCEQNENYQFVKGDICDAERVGQTIAQYGVDAVVNFAAESHVDRSIQGPKPFIDTNVTGTVALLEAARNKQLERFVQISTDEVYGSLGPKEGKFTPDHPLNPNSPYAASKASADHFVHAFGHTWSVPVNITRCSNNYGPFQFPEKMIPLMINNALHDEPLPVYGDGLQVRDWLYVYDHCTAIWQVLTQAPPHRTYNIGGCNEKTNLEVVKTILHHLDKSESLIRHVTDRPGHDRRYAIDATRIMNELHWEPSVTFEEGLSRTIQWYLNNREWLNDVTSGEYRQYYQTMYGKNCVQP